MKNHLKIFGAGLCLAGLLAASSAQAQATLTFDETGISSGFAGILHQQAADSHLSATSGFPNPGGNSAITLDYLYPPATGTFLSMGWVAIYDDANKTILSDLIHFDSSTTIGLTTYEQIFFYSIDNDGDLADHWPSGTYPVGDAHAGQNVLTTILSSIGAAQKITEDANGIASYTPTSGTPGFDTGTGATAFSYKFISSVPEPTTTMFAGAFLLLPLGARILRILRKSRAA
jgi:hypothetical protein